LTVVKISSYNKRIVARFYKFIVSVESSQTKESPTFSVVEEMFYFKTLQIFNANVSILPKEQVVSEDSWSSNTVLYHAAIDYVDGMEFEDIIQYSLIDSQTGEVLKVAQN
jgi:hypothetical protein